MIKALKWKKEEKLYCKPAMDNKYIFILLFYSSGPTLLA